MLFCDCNINTQKKKEQQTYQYIVSFKICKQNLKGTSVAFQCEQKLFYVFKNYFMYSKTTKVPKTKSIFGFGNRDLKSVICNSLQLYQISRINNWIQWIFNVLCICEWIDCAIRSTSNISINVIVKWQYEIWKLEVESWKSIYSAYQNWQCSQCTKMMWNKNKITHYRHCSNGSVLCEPIDLT